MKLRILSTIALAAIAAFAPARAVAVTMDGSAFNIVIPVVASTASYASRIHIYNSDIYSGAVGVYYFGAAGTESPGVKFCANVYVPAGRTSDFDLKAMCALGDGSNFGMLRLVALNFVSAYSRVSNPQGNGFSIEGFPEGNLFGLQLSVLGTRKSAVAPGYQTNCFVGSIDEPANYVIRIYQPDGAQVGSDVPGSVAANELKRILDIFGAAGIAAAELSDLRVEISSTDANLPALVGFCTVQNNTNFDADFRIGKSRLGHGASSLKYATAVAPAQPFGAAAKHRYVTVLKGADRIGCWIDTPSDTLLEIQLRAPDGTVAAGGNNLAMFNKVAAPRSTVAGGYDAKWTIEISPREGVAQTYPLGYTFSCFAGNGLGGLVQIADGTDDF